MEMPIHPTSASHSLRPPHLSQLLLRPHQPIRSSPGGSMVLTVLPFQSKQSLPSPRDADLTLPLPQDRPAGTRTAYTSVTVAGITTKTLRRCFQRGTEAVRQIPLPVATLSSSLSLHLLHVPQLLEEQSACRPALDLAGVVSGVKSQPRPLEPGSIQLAL